MLPFDIVFAFAIVATLLALAPGPDNIFVLMQSAMTGPRNGIFVVLGLCTGLFVHSAAVALGLAALIKASAVAFTVLKLLGACYLLYLAYQAFRAPVQSIADDAPRMRPSALYARGVIMNVTNPKVAVFFLALFPQFMDPAVGPIIPQVVQLGLVFVLVTFCVFGAIALIAGHLSVWLSRSPGVQRAINKIAGVVFVGLAAQIAFAER